MMKELVFATNNIHKLDEIRAIAGNTCVIKSLADYCITGEIPEDYNSLEENAMQKARYIHKILGKDCFADDTGLEIEALNNEPGVFSARYSRIGKPVFMDLPVNEGNIKKVLEKLADQTSRNARFRTVIALIYKNKEFLFEGIIKGDILKEKSGEHGFGYDPVFRPEGYSVSFAEMDPSEKNHISHRAEAIRKMINFIGGL